MKIDLTTAIKDINGKNIENADKSTMTFADVFKTALLGNVKDDENESANDKLWKFTTAQLVEKNKNGEIELTTEDVAKIKYRIHKVFVSPVIYGRVNEIIEE